MSLTKIEIIESVYEHLGIPRKTVSVSLKASLKSSRMSWTKAKPSRFPDSANGRSNPRRNEMAGTLRLGRH
jgi:hypothetical protein